MSDQVKTKTKIAIFTLSLILSTPNTLALAISGIAGAFPDASVSAVQMVYTLITLIGIPSALIIGKLSQYFTKKTLVIFTSLLRLAGAMIAYFMSGSMTMLLLSSVIIGFANGMVIPLTSALIVAHFKDTECEAVIGVQALFVNGGSIILNIIAGMLAARIWSDTYLLFLATIPVVIILALLLPSDSLEKPVQGEQGKVFTPYLFAIMIQGFLFAVGWMTFMANTSLYVISMGIGNEAQAGVLTTALMVGATVIGLLLPKVLKLTGEYCYAFSSAAGALGLLIFAFSSNFIMLIIASLIVGFGFGVFVPAAMAQLPNRINPAAGTMIIGFFSTAFNLGGFINPLIITNGAALINDSVSTRFLLGAILLAVNLIIGVAVAKKTLA